MTEVYCKYRDRKEESERKDRLKELKRLAAKPVRDMRNKLDVFAEKKRLAGELKEVWE